mmetsp:Transcript_19880/g.54934  ORF Transcript_19880/g.54934 Transcript_19880/m.54934 type:complete len:219 (-) Transcript_19880:979-1635(-)
MPSVARMTNSSASQSTSWIVISGSALTMSGCLKSLSPRLRETASPTMLDVARFFAGKMQRQVPLTLATPPPSASIRFFSAGLFGLWSWVSRTVAPEAFPRTALESPAFAKNNRSRICSSGPKTVMVQAVVPELSPTRFACCRKLCSVCLKPPARAVLSATSSLAFFVLSRNRARTFFARWLYVYSAQVSPPWPSKTPKKRHVAVSPRTLIGSFAFCTT